VLNIMPGEPDALRLMVASENCIQEEGVVGRMMEGSGWTHARWRGGRSVGGSSRNHLVHVETATYDNSSFGPVVEFVRERRPAGRQPDSAERSNRVWHPDTDQNCSSCQPAAAE